MAWTTTPYCTLSDVKVALDPVLGTTDDSFLSTLIIQAQADIDREIGYAFQTDGSVQTPAVRTYDGNNSQRLKIDDCLNVIQVTEKNVTTYLSSQGIWMSGNAQPVDITADIIAKPNNDLPKSYLMRYSGIGFEEGVQNYTVYGVFGYPSDASQVYTGVPNDITRACTRLAIHYYKMRDTSYADMIQEQGGIRIRYSKVMPDDVVQIIERYKRRWFLMDNL